MRGWPVGEIAFAAGFNDLSHFSRAYRARYGCAMRDASLLQSRDYPVSAITSRFGPPAPLEVRLAIWPSHRRSAF
jgi:AraC-like DNA-binding protein